MLSGFELYPRWVPLSIALEKCTKKSDNKWPKIFWYKVFIS